MSRAVKCDDKCPYERPYKVTLLYACICFCTQNEGVYFLMKGHRQIFRRLVHVQGQGRENLYRAGFTLGIITILIVRNHLTKVDS